MFAKLMSVACFALFLVCFLMTAVDLWNFSSPALRESLAFGVPLSAISFWMAKVWRASGATPGQIG